MAFPEQPSVARPCESRAPVPRRPTPGAPLRGVSNTGPLFLPRGPRRSRVCALSCTHTHGHPCFHR